MERLILIHRIVITIKQGYVCKVLWPVLGIHLFRNYLLRALLGLRH